MAAQGLRPRGCNTLRPHQAEPGAHRQTRLILRLLVSRTHMSDHICSQACPEALPEAEALAWGSQAASGQMTWGCSDMGLGPVPSPQLALPLGRAT